MKLPRLQRPAVAGDVRDGPHPAPAGSPSLPRAVASSLWLDAPAADTVPDNPLSPPAHGPASLEVPRSRRVPGAASTRGSTLLALIGVMAVMAILALALVPTGVRQIDLQARLKEAEALKVMIAGLRHHILDSRSVPSATTVFTNIANAVGWEIGMARTNARGGPRVYLVDPAFQMNTNTAARLPFTQGIYGISNVAGLRLMLISSLGSSLPAVITNPGTNAGAMFQMIWNGMDNTAPLGWSWGGNWEDINVQRLSLVPLLAQVNLQNSSAQVGRFSVDTVATNVALPTNNFTTLYFVRTRLGLHHSGGALQAVQVMQDVTSLTNGPPYFLSPMFVYEDGQWRGIYYKGTGAQKHTGEDLQWAYDIFMSGPANVYQVGGVTQSTLTTKMYLFMSNYVVWAESGFSSSKKSAVQSAQSAMASELGTYCNKKASVN